MSVFAEALEEAQGVDLAFDNYREDIRLGHKKIFYSADICRKVVDDKGVEHSIPPDDDVVSQFVHLPAKKAALTRPASTMNTIPTSAWSRITGPCRIC